jgi:hypothetical protein
LARRNTHQRNDNIAIQEALNGKAVDWMEKVSDAQSALTALGRRAPGFFPHRARLLCSLRGYPHPFFA